MSTVVVIASNNEKKAREMRSLLQGTVEIITADQANITMPEETGETFEENALLKAREAARQSGYICVADDSGLEIDALDGGPGVRSARFASDHGLPMTDDANNHLVLDRLRDVPDNQRSARFVSAVAVVSPSGEETVVRGNVEGRIGQIPKGTSGFGYDPLFIPEGHETTMAELTDEEKNEISHRGKAFRDAVPEILRLLGR
ncbi:MAG: RdgB/HAM1 family non-canonical purine NTP pyrophosphatase [Thermomicrobiaceae bacterium]